MREHISRFCVLGLMLIGIPAQPMGAAELDIGGGMEYFTVKTGVDDLAGNYYHSLLQTTLAVVQASYVNDPWIFNLQAGLSDWNVSGEWQGTGMDTVSIEPFFWAGQQKLALEGKYRIGGVFYTGLQYSNHVLEHYEGRTHYRFLKFSTQSLNALLEWEFLQKPDITAGIAVLYALQAYTEFYQSIYFLEDDILISEYNCAGSGSQWQGRIKMKYRDSAGWGLDLIYKFSWFTSNTLESISCLTIKSGSLSGCFLFRF